MGNLIKNKNLRRIIATALLAVVITTISLSSTTITASAKGSWIADNAEYNNLYGGVYSAELGGGAPTGSSSGMDWLGEQIGTLLFGIASSLMQLLATTTGDRITNFTVEGIVFGKIALPAGQNNIFGFDLTDGNYYGITGATIYAILRGFAYSGIFIMFLFTLARNLFDNSPKARDDLKEGIYGSIIAMVLMAVMPQITEMVLFGRDSLLHKIAKEMVSSGSGGSATMLQQIAKLYLGDEKLIAAILLLATMGGILFYGKDYISIALQQTILFGMFPLFNVLGTNKKKFISDWACTFFSNMAVPLIDVIILWMPYSVMRNAVGTGSGNINMIEGIVIVMMLWSSRQVRQEILKMFGNLTSSPAGRGMGGLGQMVQLARMGAMMGTKAVGAVAGTVANVAASAAGSGGEYGEFGGEAQAAQMDASSLNDMAEGISAGGLGADADAIAGPNLDEELPDLDNELAQEFGTGTIGTDMEDADASPDIGADLNGVEDMDEAIDSSVPGEEIDTMAEDFGEEATQIESAEGMQPAPFEPALDTEEVPEAVNTSSMPEGLNKFDTDRWNNLNSLDSANERLDNLRQNGVSVGGDNLSSIDDKISALDKEHQARMDKNRILNSQIDSELGKENSRYEDAIEADKNTIAYYKGQKGYEDIVEKSKGSIQRESELHNTRVKEIEKKRLNSESMAREDADYHNKRAEFLDRRKEIENANQKAIYSQQRIVDAHKDKEKRFADVSAQFGMSGKTFSGSEDMNIAIKTRDTRIEAMRQKAATMGIKREDLKGLTPEARQELAEIQRKNIRTRAIQHGVHQIGVTAVSNTISGAMRTTGAMVGAAMFAYGGEEASMAGVQLGSYAGQTVYNKTAGRTINTAIIGYNHMNTWGGSSQTPSNTKNTGNAAGGRHKATNNPRPAGGSSKGGRTTPNSPSNNKPRTSSPQKSISATSEAGSRGSAAIKLEK